MFLLNTLVQIIAVIAGIYVAFTDSFGKGVLLVVVVLALHLVLSNLSNFLMWLHQKTMKQKEIESMVFWAQIGKETEATPRVWKVIASICGFLFFISACTIIYVFVFR